MLMYNSDVRFMLIRLLIIRFTALSVGLLETVFVRYETVSFASRVHGMPIFCVLHLALMLPGWAGGTS